MADEGKVVIELVGKDSATQTFVKSFQDMQATFQRLEASGSRSAASLSSIEKNAMIAGNAVGSMTQRLLALAATSFVGYQISAGFQAAIKSIDNYKTQVIQIASTLTSLSEKGQGGIGEQFGRNLAYAEQMYRAINVESAKHFASANDMMTVYNRLTQEGYGVRLQEVGALGQVADLIKMYTGDQNLEKQLNQEIRSLMNGQARATDAMTMSLKAQLGDGWVKLVEKHKQSGDLLQWIVSLYPGLMAATGKITETWSAQYATAKSLLDLLAINGLGGAYQQIVNYLSQANDYLRAHGDELEGRVQKAWENVGPIVFGVAGALVNAANSALQLAENLDKITQNRGLMTVFGVLAGSRFGVVGAVAGGLAGLGVAQTFSNDAEVKRGLERAYRASGEFGGYEEPELAGLGYKASVEGPTKLRKPPGSSKGGKGAGALESAEKSVRSFIESMNQATAQGAGDTEAILNAWKSKQLQTLSELAAKGADITEGKDALETAYNSKLRKLNEDFSGWYVAGMGYQYQALQAEEDKKLKAVAGNEEKIAQVHEVFTKKRSDLDAAVQTTTVNLFKGYLDTMASLSPTLVQQNELKRQSLDLELKLSAAALERQIREQKINPALADEARGLEKLVAQAKKYNLEMESDKGLKGWAYARVKSDQQKNTWADAMEGLEGFVNDAWSQGIQGALTKTKLNFAELAKTMAQSFLLNLGKQGIHKAFSWLAEGILGSNKLGTDSNPMVVRVQNLPDFSGAVGSAGESGFGRTALKAGKIGRTMGKGMDLGIDWDDQLKDEKKYDKFFSKDMKDWNKELKVLTKTGDTYSDMMGDWVQYNQRAFQTDYMQGYSDSFNTNVNSMTSIWSAGQAMMTLAGVSGEAQRYTAMVSYGMQGISFLANIIKSGIIMKAYSSAASMYASVIETLPFPVNQIVAPIAAAATFVAVTAFGAMGGNVGGGGGGGVGFVGGTNDQYLMSSAGGDFQVASTGLRKVHEEETILPAWAAQSWRNIVSKESEGKRGGGGLSIGAIHIDARGASKDIDWKKVVRRQIGPELKKLARHNM
jgi:hypothetical protein